MSSNSTQSIFPSLEQGRVVQLSLSSLPKGIDNYHIDIKLSKKFSSNVKKLVALLISQVALPAPKTWDNSRLFSKLQNSYLELMTILIHRIKTDLGADEICFMQFAPVKLILGSTRSQLDKEIATTTLRLSELQQKGASEALATDQRLFWLRKNYDSILYNVNRQIFSQLQRTEEKQLAPIRKQFLGAQYQFILKALFNPLLYTSELSALPLLLNEFSMWSWNAEDKKFIELNRKLEELLNKLMPQANTTALNIQGDGEGSNEIHDEMGGLFLTQSFLGPAKDSKTLLIESFCWFEIPKNIESLFNTQNNNAALARVGKKSGIGKWWKKWIEIKRHRKILKAFTKLLRTENILAPMLASHCMRNSLSPLLMEFVDLKIVCQFLSGQTNADKLQASISGGNKLNTQQMKSLAELKLQVQKKVSSSNDSDIVKLMTDISRYRQQLKYYRIAHRAFNRLSLRTQKDELKLSSSAGTLHLLPGSSELEQEAAKICHHTVMKADIRGSTSVTDELQNKGLNPASYFSMRLFSPINKILETYGANKVFIEGDAIILSFLEFESTPQNWFSVARSCGYARNMLKIVGANNRYSSQMGLPLLELGVGICYSNDAPRYLYDEDKPIMISSAIGRADRLSSCSWNLRQTMEKGLFNVEVLRIADGNNGQDEKGQHYVRYNVNGIVVDDAGFNKLKQELDLKSLRMKLNGKQYLFHVGQYPDTKGHKRDLVIREGTVGLWIESQIHDDPNESERYYEIVVNRKVILLVLEAIAGNQTVDSQ